MNDAVQVITTLTVNEVQEQLYDDKIVAVDAPVAQEVSGYTVFAVTAEDYEDLLAIPEDKIINATAID